MPRSIPVTALSRLPLSALVSPRPAVLRLDTIRVRNNPIDRYV
jgi:hypothetical protein